MGLGNEEMLVHHPAPIKAGAGAVLLKDFGGSAVPWPRCAHLVLLPGHRAALGMDPWQGTLGSQQNL